MEIISSKAAIQVSLPEGYCVFDIETTGLSHHSDNVVLIGILFNRKNDTIATQFLAKKRSHEKEILFYFKELLSEFEGHITFNGFSFDIPFLNRRYEKYKLGYEISKDCGIDVLRLVRPHSRSLGLESCRLKEIEKAMGIARDDSISSRDSVLIYDEYEKTACESLKKKILLHNYDDILNLAVLHGKVQKKLEEMRLSSSFCITAAGETIRLFMDNSYIRGKTLYFEYSTDEHINLPVEIHAGSFSVAAQSRKLVLRLSLFDMKDSSGAKVLAFDAANPVAVKINSKIVPGTEMLARALLEAVFKV